MVTDDIRERILSYIREQAVKPRAELAELVAVHQRQYAALVEDVSDDGHISHDAIQREPVPRETERGAA